MTCPFPGMDPYLEGSLWTTLHATLAIEIVRQLAPQVGEQYLVLPVERLVMETTDDVLIMHSAMIPDASVIHTPPTGTSGRSTAVIEAPLRVTTLVPTPIPHTSIEIRDAAGSDLITAIEILSPTTKRGEGRHEYLAKRRSLLLSTAHLMEIDLLRQGHRIPCLEPLPPDPYFVFLSRLELRPLTEVWPMRLQDPLCTVPVPPQAGDTDVILDLQTAFTNVYQMLRYDRAINYTEPPDPPLSVADAKWAEERLRSAGRLASARRALRNSYNAP